MTAIKRYQELSYPDMVNDRTSVVVIGHTGRGAFWIKDALAPAGKSRRAQREELLARLEAAIEAGAQPGEVPLDGPSPTRKLEDATWETDSNDPTKW